MHFKSSEDEMLERSLDYGELKLSVKLSIVLSLSPFEG